MMGETAAAHGQQQQDLPAGQIKAYWQDDDEGQLNLEDSM